MKAVVVLPFILTGLVLLAGETPSANRGKGSGGTEPPPAKPRKEKPISVPEPATITLLAVGLAGGLLASRRRRPRN